jgi:DNA-binding beta-propeller fold protein YncE
MKKSLGRAVLIAFFSAAVLVCGFAHSASPRESSAARSLAPMAPGASGYHLLRKFNLGGEGGWDYISLDSSTRRLFISRSSHVMVVNVDSGRQVGDIENTPGVHGIALAPDLGRGFISDGAAGTITIFDMSTLKEIGTLPAGKNPDCIIYDAGTKRVFAMNGGSHDATVVDAPSEKVVATLPLPGRPEYAVADGAGHVYVNIEDKNEQAQIDSQNLAVTTHWSIAPCDSPSGLAMDVEHRRLFAGCENVMLVVTNPDTHAVVSTQAIGAGVDANRFDPGTNFIFSSNGHDGSLTVIHEDTPDNYTVVEDVPTQVNARTMELDPKTHEVYLVTAAYTAPPPPTPDDPHPRHGVVPGSFVLLVFGM